MALGDYSDALGYTLNNYAQTWYNPVGVTTTTAGTSIPQQVMEMQNQLSANLFNSAFSLSSDGGSGSVGTLETIKNSIYKIKEEAVSEETRKEVETRSQKYRRAGFARQAQILEDQLKARVRLARIKEWDYKVLPYDCIKKFHGSTRNSWTYYVHIDPVEKYMGVPEGSVVDAEFDKIVPEHVIDSLLTAQERQVFDEYSVLWVEKVKDPLLLGKIKELPDYFLIDEWGDDIKFSDILKASKKSKK